MRPLSQRFHDQTAVSDVPISRSKAESRQRLGATFSRMQDNQKLVKILFGRIVLGEAVQASLDGNCQDMFAFTRSRDTDNCSQELY